MLRRVARAKLPFVGAGFIALVAVALFLILGLGGGSVGPTDLPVVRLGQTAEAEAGAQSSTTASVPGTDGQSPAEVGGEVPTSGATSTAGDQGGGDSPVSTAGGAGSPSTTTTGQGSTSTSRAGSPATTGAQSSTQTTGQAVTTTTTTERETVTGGIRVQNGPGTTEGTGGSSSPGGGGSGHSPGTTGGRR